MYLLFTEYTSCTLLYLPKYLASKCLIATLTSDLFWIFFVSSVYKVKQAQRTYMYIVHPP